MNRRLFVLCLLLAIASLGGSLAAGNPDPPAAPATATVRPVDAGQVTEAVAPALARPLSPLMIEINAVLEANRIEIEALTARYKAAADEREAVAAMQEVIRVKREADLEILRIQLRHARQEGRDDSVARLEEAIRLMTAPRPAIEPRYRPAPRPTDHAGDR